MFFRAVGVELASEIVDHYSVEDDDINETTTNNKKHVTIVDGQSSLVPLFPQSVGKYAEDWLSRRGVEIRLSESLKSWNDRGCVLADGTVLHADVVYVVSSKQTQSWAKHETNSPLKPILIIVASLYFFSRCLYYCSASVIVRTRN